MQKSGFFHQISSCMFPRGCPSFSTNTCADLLILLDDTLSATVVIYMDKCIWMRRICMHGNCAWKREGISSTVTFPELKKEKEKNSYEKNNEKRNEKRRACEVK